MIRLEPAIDSGVGLLLIFSWEQMLFCAHFWSGTLLLAAV
jgi:hypothetical protein